MKIALGVVASLIIFLLGWFFLSGLLLLLGYVVAQASPEAGLMHYFHLFLMWVLGPGFGGFLATFVTPRIFKSINPDTLLTSFITIIITLYILISPIDIFFVQNESFSFWESAIILLQVSAMVLGAKIGKSVHEASYA